MSLNATIDYKGFIPEMPQKEVNDTLRGSYQDLGGEFFDKNLPRRFTFAGGKTLDYAPRTAAYTERKRKLFGHVNPMVFTGVTRARALSSSLTRIIAKAVKGIGTLEITLNIPAINRYRRPNMPDLRNELERVASREVPPLERFLEAAATKRFSNATSQSKTKI